MSKELALTLAAFGVCILGLALYLGTAMGGVQDSLGGLSSQLADQPKTVRTLAVYDPMLKTGTLSKIVGETTITLNYEWDCTTEGWRKIWNDWMRLCNAIPPG